MKKIVALIVAACALSPLHVWAESPAIPLCYIDAERQSERGPSLQSSWLDEVSGLAISRRQDGVFWVHNDSGDAPNIYAIRASTGELIATWEVSGASASDWEDMALGQCDPNNASQGDCLFIADVGNNSKQRTDQVIYRVREPNVSDSMDDERRTGKADAFPVIYDLAQDQPDPNPNVESLMVHPVTGKLYMVTKEDGKGRVLESDAPDAPGTPLTFRAIAEVPLHMATGADISPDGRFLAVRNYFEAREYIIKLGELRELRLYESWALPLELEPQGETMAYAPLKYIDGRYGISSPKYGGSAYDIYTISEKEGQPIWGYHFQCGEAPYMPEPPRDMGGDPLDMGLPQEPDMSAGGDDMSAGEPDMSAGGASGGSGDEGCATGAGAPAALVWLMAPFVAWARRRRARGRLDGRA